MRRNDFPLCCGATIISGFGPPGGENEWPTEEVLKKYLADKIKLCHGQAFIIAILTSQQREHLGGIFRRCGFKRKALGINLQNFKEPLALFVYIYDYD